MVEDSDFFGGIQFFALLLWEQYQKIGKFKLGAILPMPCKKLFRHLSHILICLSLGACAHARLVHLREGEEGVIAIPKADDSKSRNKALTMMDLHCAGKSVKIDEEGEALTGYDAVDVNYGMGVQSKGARNAHEWQMHFICISQSEKKASSAR